jgi:hypothetical protein
MSGDALTLFQTSVTVHSTRHTVICATVGVTVKERRIFPFLSGKPSLLRE